MWCTGEPGGRAIHLGLLARYRPTRGPVEKKPLFHFYPGSTAYSVATAGCNFRCSWCQNADISQMPRERDAIIGDPVDPEEIVSLVQQAGCRSIAYT
jgi:pyruvate formate lyase activating enzyme